MDTEAEEKNSKEKFQDIVMDNKEIKEYLDDLELKNILFKEDKINHIDWIYKNKK